MELLKEAVSRYEKAMIQSLQESIRIPSVQGEATAQYPYGEEIQRCLEHALHTAETLGFSAYDMDHQMGWCEYGEGEEMIAVLAHLDVVPAGDGWSDEPFSGALQDGKIWGRGTMDDKGPAFAALYALAALRDSGLPIKRRIRILFGTNEETGSNDMAYYKAHGGEIPVMGFTPDGEYPVINGEKGLITAVCKKTYVQDAPMRIRQIHGGLAANVVPAAAYAELTCSQELAQQCAEKFQEQKERVRCLVQKDGLRIETTGVSAHGATPQLGVNAIGLLLDALSKLPLSASALEWITFLNEKIGMDTTGAGLGIGLEDEISGKLTLNLGTLDADEENVTAAINYRYPVTKTYEDCAPIFQQVFAEAGFVQCSERHKASLYVPAERELVQTLLRVYREQTGFEAAPKSIGGGTYAKAIPNIVAFGPIFPGDEVREHEPDEFIEAERLMQNAQIFAQAMYELAK